MSVISKVSIGVLNPNELNHSKLGKKQVRVARGVLPSVTKMVNLRLFNGEIGDFAETYVSAKADVRNKRKKDSYHKRNDNFLLMREKRRKSRSSSRKVKDTEFDELIEACSSPKKKNKGRKNYKKFSSEAQGLFSNLDQMNKKIKINIPEAVLSSLVTLHALRRGHVDRDKEQHPGVTSATAVGLIAWFLNFYNQIMGISITETVIKHNFIPMLLEHIVSLDIYKDNFDSKLPENVIYEVDPSGSRRPVDLNSFDSFPEWKTEESHEGKLGYCAGIVADAVAQAFGQESKAITGSMLWNKLNRIGEFITVAPVLMSCGLVKTLGVWNNFHKYTTLVSSNLAGVAAVADFVMACKTTITEYFATDPDKRNIRIFLKGDTFENWQIDLLEFINKYQDLDFLKSKFDTESKIDMSTTISRYTLTMKAIEWAEDQYKIGKALSLDRKTHSRFTPMYMKLMTDCSAAIVQLKSIAAAGKTRPLPFSGLIVSEPGCMKSEFLKVCIAVTAGVYGESVHSSNIYTRQPGVQFYNGAQHKQGIWVFDDLGQAVANGPSDTMVNDLIGIINPISPLLNMASIEHKDNVTPECKIVWATTNVKDLQAGSYFMAPTAAIRRYPWVITLNIKAEYAEKGGCMLRKGVRFTADQIDRWDIKVQEVKAIGSKIWNYETVIFEGKPMEKVDIYTFCEWLGITAKDHKELQQTIHDDSMNRPSKICEHYNLAHICKKCKIRDTFNAQKSAPPPIWIPPPEESELMRNANMLGGLTKALYLESIRGVKFHSLPDFDGDNDPETHLGELPRHRDPEFWHVNTVKTSGPLQQSQIDLVEENKHYIDLKDNFIRDLKPKITRKDQGAYASEPQIKFSDLNSVPQKVQDYREYCKRHLGERVFDKFSKLVDYGEFLMFRRMIKKKFNYTLKYDHYKEFMTADPNSLMGDLKIRTNINHFDRQALYDTYKVYPIIEGLIVVFALLSTVAFGLMIKAVVGSVSSKKPSTPEIGLATQETYDKMRAYDARVGATESTVPFISNSEPRKWNVVQPARTSMEMAKWSNPTWSTALSNSLKSNLCCIEYVTDNGLTATGKGVFISGNVMLTTGHNIPNRRIAMAVSFGPKYENAYGKTFIITEKQVVRHPTKDLCLVLCRGALPCKNIIPYFHPDKEPTLDKNVSIEIAELFTNECVTITPYLANLAQTTYTKPDGTLVQDHLVYGYQGEKASRQGKCGSVALAIVQDKVSILGVHISGNTSLNRGFIEYVSRHDIDMMLTKFEYVGPSMPNVPTFSAPESLTLHPVPDTHVMAKFAHPECGFGVLGLVKGSKGQTFRSGKQKSDVVAIPGFVEVYDPKREYGPPKFGGFMHEGKWISNTEEKLKIYQAHNFSTDPNLTDLSGEIMVDRALTEVPSLKDAKPHTLVQTINGINGTEFKRIKATTSAGPFYPGNKELYNELLSLADTTVQIPKAIIIDGLCAIHDAYDRKESANFTFGWSEKDEPIKLEKTLRGGTRIFNPSPYLLIILMRQYFSPIVSRLQADKWTFAHKIGINAASRDWTRIANWLVDPAAGFHDGKLEATDQKTFDPRIELYAAFLDIVNIAKRLKGYTSNDIRIMKFLAYDASHVICLIDGVAVYMASGSQSGGFETAFFNSWCLEKLEMQSYWIAARHHLKTTVDWNSLVTMIPDFRKVVRLIVYGDDVVAVKHDSISWYTVDARVDAFAELGFHVTSDVKGEAPSQKCLADVTFLKRGFRYDLERGLYACPLEMTSIYKSLAYEMGHPTLTDCAYSTALVDNACREFFQHGRTTYDVEVSKLEVAIAKLPPSWKPLYDFPSYDQMLTREADGLMTKDM